MNRNQLFLSTLVLAAGAAFVTPALSESESPKTRAEVRAEAIAARQAGAIEVGDTVGLNHVFDTPSQRTRAEVQAEAIAANAARANRSTHGDHRWYERLQAPSSLSRVQVRAEAIEARRLGLIGYGDRDQPRTPTPAELESVRQAGLRAVGQENMARR